MADGGPARKRASKESEWKASRKCVSPNQHVRADWENYCKFGNAAIRAVLKSLGS